MSCSYFCKTYWLLNYQKKVLVEIGFVHHRVAFCFGIQTDAYFWSQSKLKLNVLLMKAGSWINSEIMIFRWFNNYSGPTPRLLSTATTSCGILNEQKNKSSEVYILEEKYWFTDEVIFCMID